MDIETIKNTVKEFAEKYSFIQQIDIDNVCSVFNKEKWLEMNGKKYISINEYPTKNEIVCGKLKIEINTIDEEERYYIDKEIFYRINALDYTNDTLMEAIITECKKISEKAE